MVRLLAVCFVLLFNATAAAQDSSWGVAGTMVPSWRVPDNSSVSEAVFEAERVDLGGSEFRVGVVRGRMLSGDWGVSYVRRQIDDGSTISGETTIDPSVPGFTLGETRTTRDVQIDGVEVHKFIPFGTIKQRVQIGLLLGGGAGVTRGVLESRDLFVDFFQVGNTSIPFVRERREIKDADELIVPGNGIVPLARLELAVAGLITRGLKIRVSGGIGVPGVHAFSITGLYLFGAR